MTALAVNLEGLTWFFDGNKSSEVLRESGRDRLPLGGRVVTVARSTIIDPALPDQWLALFGDGPAWVNICFMRDPNSGGWVVGVVAQRPGRGPIPPEARRHAREAGVDLDVFEVMPSWREDVEDLLVVDDL